MTPKQKLKHMILIRAAGYLDLPAPEGVTSENIDDLYEAGDDYAVQGSLYELREGEVETGLPCEWSRHYESKAVAAEAPDGSWVGWTYWYGGGKHGVPEEIDWMDEAYDLTCVEVEKMVVMQTFAKTT